MFPEGPPGAVLEDRKPCLGLHVFSFSALCSVCPFSCAFPFMPPPTVTVLPSLFVSLATILSSALSPSHGFVSHAKPRSGMADLGKPTKTIVYPVRPPREGEGKTLGFT